MSTTTVTFTTCDRKRNERSTNVRRKLGETDSELIQRTVAKLYGKSCHWWQDSGLGLFYGQVVKGSTCVTDRVRVDIQPNF